MNQNGNGDHVSVTMIPLEKLKPSPTQPRKRFDEEAHKELTESMRQHRFTLSALLVRPDRGLPVGNFEIVAGERRFRAAQAAGINEAPCFVRNLSDQETVEMQLIENIQREDLTPIEEAEGYRQILAMKKDGKAIYTLESLAQKIGRSVQTIRQRVKLCSLNEEARREVESGRFSPTVALLIAAIPDIDMRNVATQKVLHPQHKVGALSFRETEELIHREFIRDLRAASFDQADAKLLPVEFDEDKNRTAGGACLDCPFKAGNTSASGEFAKGTKHNICLKPSCFMRKEELQWAKWQQSETDPAKKRRATTQSESLRLYPRGDQLAQSFGLVDLEEYPDGSDLRAGENAPAPWKRLVRGAEIEVIVAKDGLGEVHELIDRRRAIEAATTINKHNIFKTAEREQRKTDDTRRTEEKSKEGTRELNKAILTACLRSIKVSTKSVTELLRLLIEREIEHSRGDPAFFKRHGLPIGGSVLKQLARRPLLELVVILVDFVVSEGGFMDGARVPDEDLIWLKIFGVDYGKVAKKIASSAKAIPKKKSKKESKKAGGKS